MTVTRRHTIATLAAAAAIGATGTAAGAADSDTRLLALNAELDAAWETAWSLHRPWQTAIEGAEAELRRRTKGKKPGFQMTMPEVEAWLDALYELREKSGVEDLNRRHNAAWQACDRIHELIMAERPTTAAGVAVAARATAMNGGIQHLWAEPLEILDWEDKCVRSLIEAAVAAGGMTLPPALTAEAKYGDLAKEFPGVSAADLASA